MARPYLKFYVKDFLASQSVLELTTQEIGALLLLLFSASQRDDVALPNDDKVLAKICRMRIQRFQNIKPKLITFFTLKDEKLYNEKLEKAVAEYDRIVDINKKNSAKAAEVRTQKHSPVGDRSVTQPKPEPKPQPSFKKEIIKENGVVKDKDLSKDKVEEQDELSAHMLYAMPFAADLPPAIATDNNCTVDEAKYMIGLFIEKQRQDRKYYPNYTAAENHCIFWCRKRAKHLLRQLKLNTL